MTSLFHSIANMLRKWQNLQKDVDISTTTLIVVLKNNFSLFLIRVFAKTRYSKRKS